MEQTNTTRKIWILIGLLSMSIIFWLLSERYFSETILLKMLNDEKNKKPLTVGEPMSDVQMDAEIDAALMFDSELELKSIDGEF